MTATATLTSEVTAFCPRCKTDVTSQERVHREILGRPFEVWHCPNCGDLLCVTNVNKSS